MHRAFDLGVNLFDTADVYSNGAGEEALGYALRDIPRRYVVIATKCFFPMSERPNDRGLSRKHIIESVEGSLRRLGTDYVDLLQCHRYDPNTPVEETVRAFDDLVRQGKVLYWGVSEWRAAQIVDACRMRRRAARGAPDLEPAAVQHAAARDRVGGDPGLAPRGALADRRSARSRRARSRASTAAGGGRRARARPTACATCS